MTQKEIDRNNLTLIARLVSPSDTDKELTYLYYKKYINANAEHYGYCSSCGGGTFVKYWRELTTWYSKNMVLFE